MCFSHDSGGHGREDFHSCPISIRSPDLKAGKKIMFGKEVTVKAKPAKTVVKAFPVAAIKASI